MGLFAEVAVEVLPDEGVEVFVGHAVKFCQISDFPHETFRKLLRVAIEQSMVVGLGVVVVGVGPELLLAKIATHRPKFIVVTRAFVLRGGS